MQAGCRLLLTLLLGSSALGAAGCRNRCELVENELRARDIQYREALEELGRIESHNLALQRELEAVRGGANILPEQAAQVFGIKSIVLGRLTGGYDADRLPGDELLQVIIEPRDSSDHTLKAPGTLHILALQIDPQGLKTPIGEWQISPEELRLAWKQTLLSTGYVLRLPWKTWPLTENVRVIARLVIPDGRVFEAERDFKVRPTPGRTLTPRELPVPESAPTPLFHPSLRQSPNLPIGHWQPASLETAVQLGRPTPVD